MSIIAEVWTFFSLDDSMASTYSQLFLDVMGICAVELITDAMVIEKRTKNAIYHIARGLGNNDRRECNCMMQR